ncbi:MAG: hypothetical protein V4526_01275 [Patescibacteria group bacterium]
MKRILIIAGLIVAVGVVMWLAYLNSERRTSVSNPTPEIATTTEQVWACNADAMMCPDGSSVGRTGPTCTFQACPSPDATFARIETYLGGRDGGLNLTLRPQKVILDTRCAPGTQCEGSNTVEVKVIVETKVAHGENVFKLNEPLTIGNLLVTLVEVRPSTQVETKDPEKSYWFVFEARKK